MWNQVFVLARIALVFGVVSALTAPLTNAQGSAQRQAQLAGCQSEATFRLPDVNWNQAIVNFGGSNENGEAVFLWSLPSRGLSGTCVADEDGNVAQFTVSQNPYFKTGAPQPATEAQLAACRVAANSTLPGLT